MSAAEVHRVVAELELKVLLLLLLLLMMMMMMLRLGEVGAKRIEPAEVLGRALELGLLGHVSSAMRAKLEEIKDVVDAWRRVPQRRRALRVGHRRRPAAAPPRRGAPACADAMLRVVVLVGRVEAMRVGLPNSLAVEAVLSQGVGVGVGGGGVWVRLMVRPASCRPESVLPSGWRRYEPDGEMSGIAVSYGE